MTRMCKIRAGSDLRYIIYGPTSKQVPSKHEATLVWEVGPNDKSDIVYSHHEKPCVNNVGPTISCEFRFFDFIEPA